jgi:hypothetical protein
VRDLGRYNRRLQRRHPRVRLRPHETVADLYVLEERYGRGAGFTANPDEFVSREAYVQTRDGYTTIEYFRTPPSVVRLGDALQASRVESLMQRAGVTSARELADRMDAEYDAAEAQKRAYRSGEVAAAGSEAWDTDHWRQGTRVAVPDEVA